MKDKFEALKALGAGDFQHLNGSLIIHLEGTQRILKEWGASEVLQTAGLFHAAYGTAGFDEIMVSLDKRNEIAGVIGVEEEELVYLYCSCDRDSVFPQFEGRDPIRFKDRFVSKTFDLDKSTLRLFCELTVANELELVYASDEFKKQYGKERFTLFEAMQPYLSLNAKSAYQNALANV
ncbi:hypothetical protein Q8W40_07275 [Vibrio penaeicida]|uniref:DUF6817 domain-containing protein n=1 Tax=Vibrio penaeicida TaxID=104609 RepID=UPI0027323CE1|nr:hypothetical protein [Vibrio penaeicida]MDP2571973.1 hypothetical protein [Vibrio penaeicida]